MRQKFTIFCIECDFPSIDNNKGHLQVSTVNSMPSYTPFPNAFRRACSYFPTGAVIVAGRSTDGLTFALAASTFSAVSFDPPVISIAVAKDSACLVHLRRNVKFSVSILSEAQAEVARGFGTPGAKHNPDALQYGGRTQVPLVAGALAQFVCDMRDVLDVGDHSLILAAVRWCATLGGKPLVYWRRTFFRLHLHYPFLKSKKALDLFVRNWQSGTLPLRSWTHSAHIAVTAYYALDHSSDEVFRAMKQGIVNFNVCSGITNGPDSGYHETLTQFWSQIIWEFVRNGAYSTPLQAGRATVHAFGEDRDRHRLYYSFDVVRDREARLNSIAPDLHPASEWSMVNSSINAEM